MWSIKCVYIVFDVFGRRPRVRAVIFDATEHEISPFSFTIFFGTVRRASYQKTEMSERIYIFIIIRRESR